MARKPVPIEELDKKLFDELPHLQVVAGKNFSISKRKLGLQVYLDSILDCQSLGKIIPKGSWIIAPNWVKIEDNKKVFKILRTGEDEKWLVYLRNPKDPKAKTREITPLEIGRIKGRNGGRHQECIGIAIIHQNILYRIINSDRTEDLTPSIIASDINKGLWFWQCTQ